jgi:TRAP-type C4-dicarboxylate transport system permease small subunit
MLVLVLSEVTHLPRRLPSARRRALVSALGTLLIAAFVCALLALAGVSLVKRTVAGSAPTNSAQ